MNHYLNLREGSVTVSGSPGSFLVSWRPIRGDHPDAPELLVERDDADSEQVVEWARQFFEKRDPRHLITVLIEADADPEDVRALRALFDEMGVPAIVEAGYSRASAETLPWIMLIKAPLTAFVTALAAKAGSDAWDALREAIARIFATRKHTVRLGGSIVVEDDGRTVVLKDDLPEDALRALTAGDAPTSGYLIWDPDLQAWRDALGGLRVAKSPPGTD